MQRYNSVIECKRAKKCYLEIGDKWIFSTHESWSEFQRQGLTTWIQASVLILLLVEA